jgi:Domain of unknown function (DUF5658)
MCRAPLLSAATRCGWRFVMARFTRVPLVAVLSLCLLGVAARSWADDEAQPSLRQALQNPQRPRALVPLYASFAGLQMVDMHSTWRALDHGAVEGNPLLMNVAGSKAGLFAVKAGGTAAVIGVSEALWKKNRTAAILFMISTNAAMTWVVDHNYRAVR